jgi:hypothetical protein
LDVCSLFDLIRNWKKIMPHGPAPLTAQLHKAFATQGHRTVVAACTVRVAHYHSGAAAQRARWLECIARAPARHDGTVARYHREAARLGQRHWRSR